ncbi:hypothetical protein KM043_005858 [Ampulex compressa]|nr:hypothetical protein KM043_005858 [Ampulex compressa]
MRELEEGEKGSCRHCRLNGTVIRGGGQRRRAPLPLEDTQGVYFIVSRGPGLCQSLANDCVPLSLEVLAYRFRQSGFRGALQTKLGHQPRALTRQKRVSG